VSVHGPFRSNNLSAVLAACRAGMGVCVLPWYVAQEALSKGEIVRVLEGFAPPAQEMHAVYPSPKLVPRKVSNFIAWLKLQLEGDWWERRYG
jgi:DNA-binding transcriptional LysR family regulator